MKSAWSGHGEAIARALLGEPNAALSKKGELRFGSHGSLSVDLEKECWFDHEQGAGGGMLELIQRVNNCAPAEAMNWLREQGFARAHAPSVARRPQITATYRYTDAKGKLLFEVLRLAPKSFRQRRPDGRGGWEWSLKGVARVLYQLDKLVNADPETIVFLVEGEKDADRLNEQGLLATTCPGGANRWRPEYAETLRDRRVVIVPDNDEPGRTHARAVEQALQGAAKAVGVLELPDLPPKGDVSDWLDGGGTPARLSDLAEVTLAKAAAPEPVEPTPLLRKDRPAEPIPYEALGPFRAVVEAIEAQTQAPGAIAMQSVLATASLATQAFADVETLAGPTPISLFLLSVAESGERKSACDRLATSAVTDLERERLREYPRLVEDHAVRQALYDRKRQEQLKSAELLVEDDDGPVSVNPPPSKPLAPNCRLSDVTYEGLLRHFEEGQPSIGIFSDEGGQILGGHAMNSENRLKTAAGLSKLWDAAPINRTRAGTSIATFFGRRASLHLMIQPRIADKILADPTLRDQGLLSRTLIVKPESRIGERLIQDVDAESQESQKARKAVAAFSARVTELLETRPPSRDDDPKELCPRLLRLEPLAWKVLVEFANAVEVAQKPGGALANIRGFASKAAEQAARMAGVMTIFEDEEACVVPAETLGRAVALVTWYLDEAQRLLDTGEVAQEIQQAEELRLWLIERWKEEFVDVRSIVRRGPGALRDSKLVRRLVKILEQNNWLLPAPPEVWVDGRSRREAWQVVRS